MSQPTKPRNMISNKNPNINLKKAFSFAKKAFPRKTAFITEKMTDAIKPINGD